MSWWEAAVAAKSEWGPVRILTVPEGMSLTAMASAREMARVGNRSEAARMQGLPAARAEAMREIGAMRAGESGAKMTVTPEGSGEVKLKNGAATGLTVPKSWGSLSGHPAREMRESMAVAVSDSASREEAEVAAMSSAVRSGARLSRISASR